MKKMFSAVFLGSALLLAMPAQAQMFDNMMSDATYEKNIPKFREHRLMEPTGLDVNLDAAATYAFAKAAENGSLATLPEEFRKEAAYKTKWRTVNGLTNRTMHLDQFRLLIKSPGIRFLRASDFEVAASAPPASTSAAPVTAPASVASDSVAPVRSASPADQARIRGLESRIAAAEAAASQGRLTPAELAAIPTMRTELNQLKTDLGLLTTTLNGHETRLAAAEKAIEGAVTNEQFNTALADKADKGDVGISVGGWVAIIAALVFSIIGIAIGVAVYGRTVRIKKDVAVVEKRVEVVKATVQSVKDQTDSVDIRFGEGQREALDVLPEGETLLADVFIEGEKKFEVRIKRVENGLFVFDEPKSRFKSVNPATPFKSPISSICRNYKRGEFVGFMLSAVPAAA